MLIIVHRHEALEVRIDNASHSIDQANDRLSSFPLPVLLLAEGKG
jgi:hypothetical protein